MDQWEGLGERKREQERERERNRKRTYERNTAVSRDLSNAHKGRSSFDETQSSRSGSSSILAPPLSVLRFSLALPVPRSRPHRVRTIVVAHSAAAAVELAPTLFPQEPQNSRATTANGNRRRGVRSAWRQIFLKLFIDFAVRRCLTISARLPATPFFGFTERRAGRERNKEMLR